MQPRSAAFASLALATVMLPAALAQEPPRPEPATPLVAQRAPAQAPSQAELVQRRTEKLAKPVFKQAAWLFDFDEAKQQAAAQDKLLLVYFTRSYAH
jgi:hypothetical protein